MRAQPALRFFIFNCIFGNQSPRLEIMPQSVLSSFLGWGGSISVTANILWSGGSRKITCPSFIFLLLIIVHLNFTGEDNLNFDGDNSFRLMSSHIFINFFYL